VKAGVVHVMQCGESSSVAGICAPNPSSLDLQNWLSPKGLSSCLVLSLCHSVPFPSCARFSRGWRDHEADGEFETPGCGKSHRAAKGHDA